MQTEAVFHEVQINPVLLDPCFRKERGIMDPFVDVYYLHLDESEVEQWFLAHFRRPLYAPPR